MALLVGKNILTPFSFGTHSAKGETVPFSIEIEVVSGAVNRPTGEEATHGPRKDWS